MTASLVAFARTAMASGLVLFVSAHGASCGEIASPWTAGRPETKVRLISGVLGTKPVTAVQMELADGWKTYWRFPGDSGGVPPVFDWENSVNVAHVTVQYPAPTRFIETVGDTLGYKETVIFPLVVEAKDPGKPVRLDLTLDYGVCREVCIPVKAELRMDVPPGGGVLALPAVFASALDRVPRTADALRVGDPRVVKSGVKLTGYRPSWVIDVDYPGGAQKVDMFVESPSGSYIPLPKAASAKNLGKNTWRYEIDLDGFVEPADILGKDAKVTMVSERGLSEATVTFHSYASPRPPE